MNAITSLNDFARPTLGHLSEADACREMRGTLAAVGDGAVRMAVGHNIVPFVSTRCGGDLHMLDVGMSSAYDGQPGAWRCALGPSGEALTEALYVDAEPHAPPDICTACAALRRGGAGYVRSDTHNDCPKYCSTPRAW